MVITQAQRNALDTQLPNGNYRLRATVLKALGDPANPAHWESWTSGLGAIARP